MSFLITYTELRTRCRDRADQAVSTFVADGGSGAGELDRLINAAVARLWTKVSKLADPPAAILRGSVDLAVDPSGDTYGIGSHERVTWVGIKRGTNDYVPIRKYRPDQARTRAHWPPYANGDVYATRYRLNGGNITLLPYPTTTYELRVEYISAPPKMTTSSGSITVENDMWVQFVEAEVASKMAGKEESEAAARLEKEAAQLLAEILQDADMRDHHEPERIRDVYGDFQGDPSDLWEY